MYTNYHLLFYAFLIKNKTKKKTKKNYHRTFNEPSVTLFFRVQLLYSTNHGETWHALHIPCLPGQCVGEHFPGNTLYEAVDFDR